jgi:hypothetical protein
MFEQEMSSICLLVVSQMTARFCKCHWSAPVQARPALLDLELAEVSLTQQAFHVKLRKTPFASKTNHPRLHVAARLTPVATFPSLQTPRFHSSKPSQFQRQTLCHHYFVPFDRHLCNSWEPSLRGAQILYESDRICLSVSTSSTPELGRQTGA